MIYLDTNIIVYLSINALDKITARGLEIIENTNKLLFSPMVVLELFYLYEINKLNKKPEILINHLSRVIPIEECNQPFAPIIKFASKMSWTRDPFDRIITAQAAIEDYTLITTDKIIRKHYKHVVF